MVNLFSSYDPLKKAPAFFSMRSAQNRREISVRPVWIIGDLEILHDWMNSAQRKTNWNINHKTSSVYRHYKKILFLNNAQAVMVEEDAFPLIQFDLLPLSESDFLPSFFLEDDDYIIHFLFRDNFRDPMLFLKGLTALLACIQSLSVIPNLHVRLDSKTIHLQEQLRSLGFHIRDELPMADGDNIVWSLPLRDFILPGYPDPLV